MKPSQDLQANRLLGLSGSPANLLDLLDLAIDECEIAGVANIIVPHRPGEADAEIIFRGDARTSATDAAARLLTRDSIATLSIADDRLLVRFTDDRLADIDAALESDASDALGLGNVCEGKHWVVNFADPNTTKALHIGHLRNLGLGHALASMAEVAGAVVIRQSRVGDIGRNMGEALAGYLSYGEERIPKSAGLKGDAFVGQLYARYVRESNEAFTTNSIDVDTTNAPLARERDKRNDLAEIMLQKWNANDPDVVALFQRMRQWVMEGHDVTLARLGIAMDRVLCESDYLSEATRLVEKALANGIATRAPNDAVVYDTGFEEYPHLLLTRSDGFPTQHLRYIATWDATSELYEGVRSLSVVGSEWGPLTRYCDDILRRLHPGHEIHPTDSVLHEMVTIGSGIVKSSEGDVPLIDDLLDKLCESQRLKALYHEHSQAKLDDIVAAVTLGVFLGRIQGKRLLFSAEDLLGTGNVGLMMMRAWLKAGDAKRDGSVDIDLGDPDHRFVLGVSQLCRRLLIRCLHGLEVLPLARYYFHLSRWYLSAADKPALARPMGAILDIGLAMLGLGPARMGRALEPAHLG